MSTLQFSGDRLTVMGAAELLTTPIPEEATYLNAAHTMIKQAEALGYLLPVLDSDARQRWDSEHTLDIHYTAFLDKPTNTVLNRSPTSMDHHIYLGAVRRTHNGRPGPEGVATPIGLRVQGNGAHIRFYEDVPTGLGWIVNAAAGMLDRVNAAA